ncbi:hypothetical protein GGI04_001164 [Coemansia thaxteri]|nr:hypothetical protein GGI04_001164 [Coemansia thaxteri]KAJ2485944.1 hypothetical protein EV174_001405 [Coemansia sp. RSA 2320]
MKLKLISLLVLGLLAAVSQGLPGVFDIGGLLGDIGLLNNIEKLLTSNEAPQPASATDGSATSKGGKQNHGGMFKTPSTHMSSALGALASTINGDQPTTRSSDDSGLNSLLGTSQTQPFSFDMDASLQSGTSEASTSATDDLASAAMDGSMSSSRSGGTTKTVLRTQFVVVASGGASSTLVISEPQEFSALDSSANAAMLIPRDLLLLMLLATTVF